MSWLLERRLICHDNDAELLPLSPSSGSCQLVLELHHVLSSRQFRLKLLLLSYESQYRWIFHAISGYFASKAVQTQCRVQYWAENMHYTKYKHLPQLTCRITSHFLVLTGLLDVWCTWCLRVFVGTPVSFLMCWRLCLTYTDSSTCMANSIRVCHASQHCGKQWRVN